MKSYDPQDQNTTVNLPSDNDRGWYKFIRQITRPMLPQQAVVLRYLLAVVLVLLAVIVRLSFNIFFDPAANISGPFLLLYTSVLLTAWYAGFGPGLLATILSVLFRNLFLLDQSNTVAGFVGEDIVNQIIFLLEGLVVSVLCQIVRKSLQRADVEIAERRRVEASLREQRQRFAVTLASIGDAVAATDADGRVTFLNQVASDLMGWSDSEAAGQPLNKIFKIVNEYSRQVVENPVDKVLASGKVVGLANHTLLLARNGREIPIDDSGAPIRDSDGTVKGVVLVFRDISERKIAEHRQELLVKANVLFNSSLDYRATLENIARLVVPDLADWCTVYLRENNQLRRLELAHFDTKTEQLGREILANYNSEQFPDHPAVRVLTTGLPNVIQEVSEELMKSLSPDEATLQRLQLIRPKSILSVPLQVRGELIGVLSLVTAESGRIYGEDDIDFVQELAYRAALAMDNARLFQQEQQSLLETERARERVTFLAQVSEALTTGLDYQASLEKLARLVVPFMADYCLIDIVENADEVALSAKLADQKVTPIIRRAAVAHVDPAKEKLMHEVQMRYPPDPNSRSGIGKVIHTGEIVYAENVEDAALVQVARSPEHLRALRELASQSGVSLPLIARGRIIGVLSLAYAGESGRKYDAEEVNLARDLARRAAMALDNARLYNDSLIDQERQTYLAEASRVLSSSLDYETTFQSVAKLTVPRLADWCTVHILPLEEDPNSLVPRQVALAHFDPAKVRWAEEFQKAFAERYPYDPDAPTGLPNVIRTGQPEVFPDIPEEMLLAVAGTDEELLHILREIGFSSSMSVPIIARGRVLGAIQFVATTESGKHYDANDLTLAQNLANRAALALDNARLYKEAQGAIAVRNEFLSIAAHELKTPITSLQGYAQLQLRRIDRVQKAQAEPSVQSAVALATTTLDMKSLRQSLETINFQTDKLRRLVERLLDLSRLESGRLILEPAPVNIVSLVQDAARMVQIISSRHQISVETSEPELIVLLDRLRFEQVVLNLIENAIKYSPDGGPVVVSIHRTSSTDAKPEQVQVSVRDRGIGISPDQLDHVFQRFYQAHTGKFGGMGLGLYVSRQIVELHGGYISVESLPEGGTCFTVSLPLTAQVVVETLS